MSKTKPINPDELRNFIGLLTEMLINLEERLSTLEQHAGLAPKFPEPPPAEGNQTDKT